MNVGIVDWDDTLCPSRVITFHQYGTRIEDIVVFMDTKYNKELMLLDEEVRLLLLELLSCCHMVRILSNGTMPWIMGCMELMPKTYEICHRYDIKVISTRTLDGAKAEDCPLTWKRLGFAYICDRIPADINVLTSIGDSECERLACLEYFQHKRRPVQKCRIFHLIKTEPPDIVSQAYLLRKLRLQLNHSIVSDPRILIEISLCVTQKTKKEMIFLILGLATLFIISIYFIVTKYNNNNNKTLTEGEGRRKKKAEWISPGPVSLIRAPPPCLAPNPVATPCESSDPIAKFPNAVLYLTDAAQVDIVVVDSKSNVYASGKSAGKTPAGIVSIPLKIADPIPIRASEMTVQYVAVLDGGTDTETELRLPVHLLIQPNKNEHPKKEEEQEETIPALEEVPSGGKVYDWTVLNCVERQPLITETFLDRFGRCIQDIDEGGQNVVPAQGSLDNLTVYLPHQFDKSTLPVCATVYVNNRPTSLSITCSHQSTQSSSDQLIHIKAGDRFGIKLENHVGNFGYIALALRYRY